ncbi:MAG: diacylglycerol kinase family lipid kinase [Truepera sp.]|nr:diacylglycerol kinase family lipid kinase [Truepera sp.]
MVYLLFNPAAGRGRARSALGAARHLLGDAGLDHTLLCTESPGHATRLVEALPGDARVLVLGGDGTVHEAALACLGSERTLGLLPAGSGDDFAFALGIGRYDLAAAVATVRRGRVRMVDSGLVNGVPFINAVGVGFDADITLQMQHVPQLIKGRAAYLWALLATLARHRCLPLTVDIDGRRVFSGPSLLVSTHNGPRVGGSFYFAPEASVEDGLFDVIIAGSIGRLGALAILPQVMKGRHLGHPQVFPFRGRRVKLRWGIPRPAHLEGELMAATSEFDLEIRPRSLRVFA